MYTNALRDLQFSEGVHHLFPRFTADVVAAATVAAAVAGLGWFGHMHHGGPGKQLLVCYQHVTCHVITKRVTCGMQSID